MNRSPSSTGVRPTHEQISERAKAIWKERGEPSGQDDDIWFEAERQLEEQRGAKENPMPAIAPVAATGIASTATALPQAAIPAVGLKSSGTKKRKAR